VARTRSSLRERPAQALTSLTVADGDTVVVQLWGEHDGSTVPLLSKVLASAVGLDHPNLVIDLSRVQFINSATVRIFMESSELLDQADRTFALRAPSRSARRVIDLCGAGTLIEAASTPDTSTVGTRSRLVWPTVPEGT